MLGSHYSFCLKCLSKPHLPVKTCFCSRPCCNASSLWLSPELSVRIHHSILVLPRLHEGHDQRLTVYISVSSWVSWESQLCCVNPYIPSVPRQCLADSENWVPWNKDLFETCCTKTLRVCLPAHGQFSVLVWKRERKSYLKQDFNLVIPSFSDDYGSCSKNHLQFIDLCIHWADYHIALSLLGSEVYDETSLFEGTRHELLRNTRRMLRPTFVSTKK